ncbi:MAG: hypothetical protein WCK48_02250 [bacterium]
MEEKKIGIGSTVGTIIIIALIVLGGLYFWGKRIEESKNIQQMTSDTTQTTADQSEAAVIKTLTPDDEISSIEQDLKNTNVDSLGSELQVQAQ